MNYKIILSKTTSAIFLATVLFAGTIAISYPSFMIDAQAHHTTMMVEGIIATIAMDHQNIHRINLITRQNTHQTTTTTSQKIVKVSV